MKQRLLGSALLALGLFGAGDAQADEVSVKKYGITLKLTTRNQYGADTHLYDLSEPIVFDVSTSKKKTKTRFMDVENLIDFNNDGNLLNDNDLPLTYNEGTKRFEAGLSGVQQPGVYGMTAHVGSKKKKGKVVVLTHSVIGKPHPQYADVADQMSEFAPGQLDTAEQPYLSWLSAVYPLLSPGAQAEIAPLQDAFGPWEDPLDVTLATFGSDRALLYNVGITDPTKVHGFTPENGTLNYGGRLPISETTANEILNLLSGPVGQPISYFGTVNSGAIPDGWKIELWMDANKNGVFDHTGAFTPSGSEDFNLLGLPTESGFYGVLVPADNPATTSIFEGWDQFNPLLNKGILVVGGIPCSPVLTLEAPGLYVQNVTTNLP